MGQFNSNLFDKKGLRVSPLELKVHPSASFRMPCRFIRDGILKPLKTMLDQFVSEGVLILDSSCDFTNPNPNPRSLLIKEMVEFTVNYREVNMQLDSTAKSIAISAYFISKIEGQRFYAMVDNLWDYHQLRLTENSSKVTDIINPWEGLQISFVSNWYINGTW